MRCSADEIVIYSVGQDRKDDGGEGDDVSLRVALKSAPK